MAFEGKTIRILDLPYIGRTRIVEYEEIDNHDELYAQYNVRGITKDKILALMKEVLVTNMLDDENKAIVETLDVTQLAEVHKMWITGSKLL